MGEDAREDLGGPLVGQRLVLGTVDAGAFERGGVVFRDVLEEALSAVVEAIKVGVQKSGKVQIMGFGTFATKTRAARTGRNPKTGEAITIPASQTVAFKASSSLKA